MVYDVISCIKPVVAPSGRRFSTRYYMFVICDRTTPPWATLPEGVTYLVCQHERGTHLGNDHLQGYVELNRSQEMGWCHRHLHPTMQMQRRYGTQAQAIAYCTKEDTRVAGPWAYGTPYAGGTSTSKAEQLRDLIYQGANMRDLIQEMPTTLSRHLGFARLCLTYRKPLASRDVVVFLLYGKTRTGKSRFVFEQYTPDDLYVIPFLERKSWFDGYDGEPNVLLDDFSGGMPRTQLLRLLDRYRFRVPCKGGFCWWSPIRIYITTNIHPRKWYRDWQDFEEHYDALEARMTAVYDFNAGETMEDRLTDTITFFSRVQTPFTLARDTGTTRTPFGGMRFPHSRSRDTGARDPYSGYNDY